MPLNIIVINQLTLLIKLFSFYITDQGIIEYCPINEKIKKREEIDKFNMNSKSKVNLLINYFEEWLLISVYLIRHYFICVLYYF